MLHWLGSLNGVNKISFDFCALGMRSTMPNGHEGPALKRTSVLTNSGHIGALLSKAKCKGLHEHVRLEDGGLSTRRSIRRSSATRCAMV